MPQANSTRWFFWMKKNPNKFRFVRRDSTGSHLLHCVKSNWKDKWILIFWKLFFTKWTFSFLHSVFYIHVCNMHDNILCGLTWNVSFRGGIIYWNISIVTSIPRAFVAWFTTWIVSRDIILFDPGLFFLRVITVFWKLFTSVNFSVSLKLFNATLNSLNVTVSSFEIITIVNGLNYDGKAFRDIAIGKYNI